MFENWQGVCKSAGKPSFLPFSSILPSQPFAHKAHRPCSQEAYRSYTTPPFRSRPYRHCHTAVRDGSAPMSTGLAFRTHYPMLRSETNMHLTHRISPMMRAGFPLLKSPRRRLGNTLLLHPRLVPRRSSRRSSSEESCHWLGMERVLIGSWLKGCPLHQA